jgi:trehalose 6-phosphate phosphatase
LETALRRGTRILVASDFDGTLCPIVRSPFGGAIPPVILEALRRLLQSGRVSLSVISGRALGDISSRVALPAVVAGNHGLEISGPGMEFEHPDARRLAPLLAEAAAGLARAVTPYRGAWVEDKRLTLTVHYRGACGRDQCAILPAVRREMGRFGLTFGMRAGKKAIEIYPRIGWQKGSALCWIRERLGLEGEPCLVLGDDQTDESMFTANAAGPNISVGFSERSAAGYFVREPLELVELFGHLAGTAARNADAGQETPLSFSALAPLASPAP